MQLLDGNLEGYLSARSVLVRRTSIYLAVRGVFPVATQGGKVLLGDDILSYAINLLLEMGFGLSGLTLQATDSFLFSLELEHEPLELILVV